VQPIHALSSGQPPAGVAVVRLSGSGSFGIAERLLGGAALPPPRAAMLRSIFFPETQQLIDKAIIICFAAPHSFTGEDVVEFHCHGSPAVVSTLQAALARCGSRPAEAGEFSRRAFLHGRMDLTGAEALADLLVAETEAQRHLALSNVDGRLRRQADSWRQRLIALLAEIEADLDFSDEADVGGDVWRRSGQALGSLIDELERALAAAPVAERIRHGLVIAIVGPPNVGKSSLLNAIARREVAIVTPHAGTTRDVLEVQLDLGGLPAVLLDTAGIRETGDPVEMEGIARARARAAAADLVLDLGPGGNVVNRIDLCGAPPGFRDGRHHLSAKTGAGLAELEQWLAAWAGRQIVRGESPLVTTARQQHLLAATLAGLREAAGQQDAVLAAESLRSAANALGRMTGLIDPEAVLGAIFSRFCIGK